MDQNSEEVEETSKDRLANLLRNIKLENTGCALDEDIPLTVTVDQNSEEVEETSKDRSANLLSNLKLENTRCALDEDISDITARIPKPMDPPKIKPCRLIGNFVKLKTCNKTEIYEYNVAFKPDMDCWDARQLIMLQFAHDIGKMPTYDGDKCLFLTRRLEGVITTLTGHNPYDHSQVVIVYLQLRDKVRTDRLKDFFDVLFHQLLRLVGLTQVKTKFYEPDIYLLEKHKLFYGSGFTTFVRYTDNGLMVGLNLAHLIQRERTIYDIFEGMLDQPDYKNTFSEYVAGQSCVTAYSNNFYSIGDIDWNITPNSITTHNGSQMSYSQYYRMQFNIKIEHPYQPMLITQRGYFNTDGPSFRECAGGTELIAIPSELCFLAGITEDDKPKEPVLRDLGKYTLYSPAHRITTTRQLIAKLKGNDECVTLFTRWGLEIEDDLVHMDGKVISGPTIQFNQTCTMENVAQDFTDTVLSRKCFKPVSVSKWLVFCMKEDARNARDMIKLYIKVASKFGIIVTEKAKIVPIRAPDGMPLPEDFRTAILKNVTPGETQFIVVVLPQMNEDIYGAVKSLCLTELRVPSQVILASKIRADDAVRQIMERVVLQVNCKLGGSIWALKIPMDEAIMFVGMDTFHDPHKESRSVHGMVASLNTECTSYYSRATIQAHALEICLGLKPIFVKALLAFLEDNFKLPDRIIVFRDGITARQFENLREYEISAMLEAIKEFEGFSPKFCFMSVQKRIWEKIYYYAEEGVYLNPPLGTVLDNTITKPQLKDFYVIPQIPLQGTATPVHCVVVEDCGDNNLELAQKFAHVSAFMYYNWPGSVRLPAMVMYAHKLASFVGLHLESEPIGSENRLYYL